MKHRHIFSELPEGYHQTYSFKLTENIEIVRELSHLELLIAAALFLAGLWIHPLSSVSTRSTGFDSTTTRLCLIPFAVIAYLIIHEFTHVFFMRLFGAEKIVLHKEAGVAATGSSGYYDKFSFLLISLAPVLIWGILLGVLCFLVPVRWFWVVYPAFIINFSGSSSDYYSFSLARKAPDAALIQDTGLEFTIYSKS